MLLRKGASIPTFQTLARYPKLWRDTLVINPRRS
jgi:hypothetical protein